MEMYDDVWIQILYLLWEREMKKIQETRMHKGWISTTHILNVNIFFINVYMFQRWEDITWVLSGIFNVFWSTLFLVNWKRTSNVLVYHWGTFEKKSDLIQDPRPLYTVWGYMICLILKDWNLRLDPKCYFFTILWSF